jgi:hypothetical protein
MVTCYYQYFCLQVVHTYTFTPAAGQCALPFTMSIVITTRSLQHLRKLDHCVRTVLHQLLPLTSTNGITVHGHLLLFSTLLQVRTTYTFTPAAGQCALPFTMEYCDHYADNPTFTQIGPLCQNSTAPTLPLTSTNGITGTWSPATIQYCMLQVLQLIHLHQLPVSVLCHLQ